MTEAQNGRKLLEEVALRYAKDHGLRPDNVEWVDQGYEWLLRINTENHTVRVGFSADEIDFFATGSPEAPHKILRKVLLDNFCKP